MSDHVTSTPAQQPGRAVRVSATAYTLITVVGIAAIFGGIVAVAAVGPAWTALLARTIEISELLAVLLVLVVALAWVPLAVGAVVLHKRVSTTVHWLDVGIVIVVGIVGPLLTTAGRSPRSPRDAAVLADASLVTMVSNLSLLISWLGPPLVVIAYGLLRMRDETSEREWSFVKLFVFALVLGMGGVVLRVALIGSDLANTLVQARNDAVTTVVGEVTWRGVVFGLLVGSGFMLAVALVVLRAYGFRIPAVVPWLAIPPIWFFTLFGPPGLGRGSAIDRGFALVAPGFQHAVVGGFIASLFVVPLALGLGLYVTDRRKAHRSGAAPPD